MYKSNIVPLKLALPSHESLGQVGQRAHPSSHSWCLLADGFPRRLEQFMGCSVCYKCTKQADSSKRPMVKLSERKASYL